MSIFNNVLTKEHIMILFQTNEKTHMTRTQNAKKKICAVGIYKASSTRGP